MRPAMVISAVAIIFLVWQSGSGRAMLAGIEAPRPTVNELKSSIKTLDSLLWASYPAAPGDLRKRLGTAGRIDTFATINRHDDGRDTVFTFHFNGVSVQSYYAAISAKYFLQQIDLLDLGPLAPLGITAGMTQDQLVALFEEPYTIDPPANGLTGIRYEAGDEASDYIVFLFKSGRLVSLTFLPYLD